LSRERAVAALAAVSGVLALALTAVGLYGVTAYRVRRRTSEFGVRLALGARRRSVVGMVLREVLQEGCAGVLVGLPILYVVLRSINAWLFGVAPIDPLDSAVAAMIIAVSLAAAALTPALRASRISPIEAIRQGEGL
jgi:ABC-type antimicrobial peptide transport system permease subunit